MERLFTIEIRENAQLIAESMPGAAFVFCDDPEEHIVYANEMMWKIVGCDSLEEYMEFTGGSRKGMVKAEDLEETERKIRRDIVKNGSRFELHYRVLCKDQRERFVETRGKRISLGGEHAFFAVMVRDETRFRQESERMELIRFMRQLQKFYDLVRLVEVDTNTQYTLNEIGELVPGSYKCFTALKRNCRCENCVSAKALWTKRQTVKFECIDNDIYYVTARSTMLEGKAYVLELIKKITDETMFGALGDGKFTDVILQHNKKIYMDALTGTYNRNYYEEQFFTFNTIHAIAMLDVDDYKKVNDQYGHPIGDQVLREIAGIIREHMRECDVVIRYGGDEFMILFGEITEDLLRIRMEQIRTRIAKMKLKEAPGCRISISAGAGLFDSLTQENVKRVDQLLYEAKKTKNMVCIGE